MNLLSSVLNIVFFGRRAILNYYFSVCLYMRRSIGIVNELLFWFVIVLPPLSEFDIKKSTKIAYQGSLCFDFVCLYCPFILFSSLCSFSIHYYSPFVKLVNKKMEIVAKMRSGGWNILLNPSRGDSRIARI